MNNKTKIDDSRRNQKASRIRFRMIFLAMLVAVLLYLDRMCLSTASKAVQEDLGISKTQLDWLLGAFFWTYAAGQLPAGWLGDRYGARWMLSAFIVLWSLSTGLMGVADGFTAVLILRLFCGLFEAGAYPIAAGIVSRWMPIGSRGMASSVVAVGGRLGGALAPVVTIQLMLWWTLGQGWWGAPSDAVAAPASWRPVMILYGVIGIVIAMVFVWLFRDSPEQHPGVNQREREWIQGGTIQGGTIHASAAKTRTAIPLLGMLQSFPLWLNCFVQFASNMGWAFLATKMPQYLKDVHGTSQSAQGWLVSLPLLAGIAGLLLGGVFTDAMTRSMGLRWGRAIAMCVSRVVVAIGFLGCSFVTDSIQATIYLAVVGFATDLGIAACWAFAQDVGGKHVGSVLGWANMWGNFGAALSPVILGGIVGSFVELKTGWTAAFLFCALLNLVAAFAAIGINAKKPM